MVRSAFANFKMVIIWCSKYTVFDGVLVTVVDSLGRLRSETHCAAYESSFVEHRTKRFVKPVFYVPCMVYISWSSAVYPNRRCCLQY
ncbi:DUF4400 domain-containing protein [Dickeya dianthicola]|nr:DUF4400 domain-containing protein [Dickeya dianthicola]QOL13613.1 DUF4400 domain-containing protein [Dickeya dianthicola]